jgi:hypothetical protein
MVVIVRYADALLSIANGVKEETISSSASGWSMSMINATIGESLHLHEQLSY